MFDFSYYRTTTDNARNFVKAFGTFGTESGTLPGLEVTQDVQDSDPEDSAETALLTEVDEFQAQFVSISDSLVPVSESGTIASNPLNLPGQMRCAAHTFNLVASKDADGALQDAIFKGIYRSAMAKACALWNLQDRSTVAADKIYEEIQRRLLSPNATRWNSTYDSVVVLNSILEDKRPALHRVMTQLKIKSFNDQDVGILKEYTKVIK